MLHRLPDLPLVKQKTNHTCGAASLLCALRFLGLKGHRESDIAKQLKTDPRTGVDSGYMAKAAREIFMLKAIRRNGLSLAEIETEIGKGHLAIVDFQAWRSHKEERFPWRKIWVDGHYGVVQAMDQKHIWIMDPWIGRIVRLTHKAFLERWHTGEPHENDKRKKMRHSAVLVHGKY